MPIHCNFDPTDPTGVFYSPAPENMTQEELKEYQRLTERMLQHGTITVIMLLVALAVLALFSGCTTTRETSYLERQHVTDIMQRMDSLMSVRTVVQQDSTWRQEILRQFQSIREKSDTSHYVVTDTAGKVIKEKIVINNTREVTSETDRQELTVMSHRLEQMDSTMQVMQQQLSHSDSLLQQQREKTVKTVTSPLTWWQNLQIIMGRLALLALAVLAIAWVFRKKILWFFFSRK